MSHDPNPRTGPLAMIETSCVHEHPLLFAERGELAGGHRDPSLWRVAVDGFVSEPLPFAGGEQVALARGTRLRYQQRDYDRSWRHEGWDRFLVVGGEHVGTCVIIMVDMPGSPVANDSGVIAPDA